MGKLFVRGEISELRGSNGSERLGVYAGQRDDGKPAGLIWIWLSDLSDADVRAIKSLGRGATVGLELNFSWRQTDDGSYAPSFRAVRLLPPPTASTPAAVRAGPRGEGGAGRNGNRRR